MNLARALQQRWRLVAAVLVVALVLAAGLWWVNRPPATERGPMVGPTPSSTPPTTPALPSTPPSSAAPASSSALSVPPTPTVTPETPSRLAGCQPPTEGGFVPDRFTMARPVADERVLSLGLDDDGAIAAPPKNQPRTAAWWNQGPRAGSTQGKVVLSIHTYRTGKALGNEMYADGSPAMRPGDLIKLYGPDGKVACYEFVEAKKVWVDEYDPNSDVMVDFEGDPMLAIVICWDFKPSTEEWRSRIFFYATPVHA